ncbi:MAG: hypothetical protein V3R94_02490 [Acidobacteriota bacterium]
MVRKPAGGEFKLTGFRVGEPKLLSLFGWGIRVFGLWGPGFGRERVLVKMSGFWGCWLIPSEGTGWSFRSNQGGSRELLKLGIFRLQSDIS